MSSSPTSSSSGSPSSHGHRSETEKQRRDDTNDLLNEFKKIVQKSESEKLSKEEVLFRIVKLLSGIQLHHESFSTSPGPIRSIKKIKSDREQVRRNKRVAAYRELRKFIALNNLSSSEEIDKMENLKVLEIIFEVIRGKSITCTVPCLPFPILPFLPVFPVYSPLVFNSYNQFSLYPPHMPTVQIPIVPSSSFEIDALEIEENEKDIDIVG